MDDYSEASFQIPVAASSSSNLLLADESGDFFNETDLTLTTPAVPRRARLVDDPPAAAEPTPRSRLPRMPVRRSPRKHRGTPVIATPLKPAVARDLSAALDDTLSPFRRPEQSFQIPAMADATADMLLADDDGGALFGAGGEASFGDAPARADVPEPLTLSQLTSPPKAPSSPPVIRSLSPHEHAIPELSAFSNAGNQAARLGSPSPPRAPFHGLANLKTEVEAFEENVAAEEPRRTELSPSPLPQQPQEVGPAPAIDSPAQEAHHDVLPAEDPEPMDIVEMQTSSDPVPPRAAATTRDTQAKKLTPTVIGGGIAKRSSTKSRLSAAVKDTAKKNQKAQARRRTRAASVAAVESPASVVAAQAGPSRDAASPHVSAQDDLAVPMDVYDQETPADINGSIHSVDTIVPSGASDSEMQRMELEDEVQATDTPHAPADDEPDLHAAPIVNDLAASQESPSDDPIAPETELALASVTMAHDKVADEPSQPVAAHDVVAEAPAHAYPVVPPSPMRTSNKRAASAGEDGLPEAAPRKRSRVVPSMAASPRARGGRATGPSLAAKRSVRVLRSSRVKNAAGTSAARARSSGRSSTTGLASTAAGDGSKPAPPAASSRPRTAGGAARREEERARDIGHLTRSGSGGPAAARASAPTSAHPRPAGKSGDTRRADASHDAGKRRHVPAAPTKSMARSEATGSGHMRTRKPIPERLTASVHAAAAKATRPVEFNFASDARIEARKADGAASSSLAASTASTTSNSTSTSTSTRPADSTGPGAARRAPARPPIPDSARPAPTVPVAFAFSTSVRAAERERFEAARRAREAEALRAAEEQREREREREEEEVREMRRRAVPRANEVPEWYAHAPKREREREREARA